LRPWFIKNLYKEGFFIQIFTILSIILTILFLYTFSHKIYAEKKIKIAILPFENMSSMYCNVDFLMDIALQTLQEYDEIEFCPREETDKVINELRLRHTGYLTTDESMQIGEKLGVHGILFGILALYQEEPEPRIGVILKLVSTREPAPIVWMDTGLGFGNDGESLFGLNRIREIDRLARRFFRELFQKIPFNRLEDSSG